VSFGLMPIFARAAYAAGANVFTALTFRFAIAAVVLLLISRIRGLALPRGRTLLGLVALGGLVYTGQALTYFAALSLAPAGLAVLLLYLYPGMVMLLATLAGQERLTRTKLAAVALALLGSALTVSGGAGSARLTPGLALGVFFGVLCAVLYAVYIVAGAGVTARAGAIPSCVVLTGCAAAVTAVPMLAQTPRLPHGAVGWAAIVGVALVSTVLGTVTFIAGLARLGPSTSATLSTLEPVVTVVLAGVLLAEPLGPVQLVGGVLILGAALLVIHASRARKLGTPPGRDGSARLTRQEGTHVAGPGPTR
jgi:drug/metabolite transporter (DMT)-like permease